MLKEAEGFVADVEKETGKDAPMVLLTRADIERIRGQHIQAIKLLEKADTAFTSMGQPSADVKIRLAELYRQDGNLGAARKLLTELALVAPTYARGYYLQALIAAQMNDSNKALTLLDKGLRLSPGDKDMLQLKLLVLKTLGKTGKEAEQIAKEVEAGGSSVADKLRQATLKIAEQEPEQAEALYQEVLDQEPTNITALRMLLEMLIRSNRTSDARELFNKAKAAAPNNPNIRGLQFLFMGNVPAEQRDQKILELVKAEPDPIVRNTQLFAFYFARQKYDDAAKAVEVLKAKQPDSDRVVYMQFSLAMARQNWDAALKCADEAGQRDLDGAEGGFLRAQVAMRRGDLVKAQSELRQALTRYPSHPNGWVWLGEVLMQSKQYDQARDVLVNKALELNPTKGEAYKDLAYIAEQQGNEDAYRTNLKKAMQYLPRDPWVAERGIDLREQEDPDRAIEIRRKALASNPDDTENMIRLALLLEKKEQYKEAGSLLDRAATAAAKNLQVIWTAAEYWQRRGDAARAENMLVGYEQGATGDSKAAANALLGQLYMQDQKPEKAEQAYKVAAKISTNPQIKAQLGDFYRNVGRGNDAAGAYRQAIAAGTDATIQGAIRQKLIELLLQTQKLKEAATEIEAYHKAAPDDQNYLLMRGTLLALQGQTDAAVSSLSAFLQNNRKSAAGFYRRGMLYLAMNQLPQAIDDLTSAKSLSPDGFGFQHRIALAQALEANKQPDRAVAELKDILRSYPPQNYPQSTTAAKALATLYQRTGRGQDFEALAESFISQFPKDWSWPMALGQYCETAGNMGKAARAYGQAIQASGWNLEPVDNLLRLQIARKNYNQVIDYVEKQMPEAKRVGPAKARLAEAYFYKGQKDKARTIYSEALQESAGSYGASVLVLRSISATLKPQAAIEMLRKQLAAKPDDQGTRFLLSSELIQQGKYDEAPPLNDQMLAAAKTDTDRILILRQRGSLLYEAGKYAAGDQGLGAVALFGAERCRQPQQCGIHLCGEPESSRRKRCLTPAGLLNFARSRRKFSIRSAGYSTWLAIRTRH